MRKITNPQPIRTQNQKRLQEAERLGFEIGANERSGDVHGRGARCSGDAAVETPARPATSGSLLRRARVRVRRRGWLSEEEAWRKERDVGFGLVLGRRRRRGAIEFDRLHDEPLLVGRVASACGFQCAWTCGPALVDLTFPAFHSLLGC